MKSSKCFIISGIKDIDIQEGEGGVLDTTLRDKVCK